MASMTRDEVLALPATVDLVTGGRALGMGETKTRELARAGQFPVRLLRVGNRYRVVTAELIALLGISEDLGRTA
ncbi:hypothetical protein CLV43_10331 [Umezawaea tangerina]|uniref:Excisionase family DNA binding protein n=2 Tax=Umezawaea tangerina TaxID=84725 RepID=A0A2T0TCA9_9PSEU|nr:hypothetical protein CLV43_10331 [Umezawaea tangerina]